MDVWTALIFGAAALAALRVLAGLMTSERERLLREAEARAAAEQAEQAAADASKKKAGKKGTGGASPPAKAA